MKNYRIAPDTILHQLFSPENDGAQNGDLEILRLGDISCDRFERHHHGNGILHDAKGECIFLLHHISNFLKSLSSLITWNMRNIRHGSPLASSIDPTISHMCLGLYTHWVQILNYKLVRKSAPIWHCHPIIRHGSLLGKFIGSNKRSEPNKRSLSSNWNTRVKYIYFSLRLEILKRLFFCSDRLWSTL